MITAENTNGTLILTIEARTLEAANAVAIKQAMQEAIGTPGGAVVVDLRQVELIDSAGVGVLLGINKYNQEKVALRNAGREVMSVLKLLRLQRLLLIEGA
ncbi:STAS domain-containing protein [Cerasicoccus frondis]|uniref:STAS domain-containing protein n=1 Tax=Cerasicoccus frondis TaxID=490090 RepID=UPI0028526075|nr:STAS domain-containing protein [Cerasicoccus frondis]